VSQKGPRHFREGTFDEIQPRAMFGGMHINAINLSNILIIIP
jgi:hypothetical protein